MRHRFIFQLDSLEQGTTMNPCWPVLSLHFMLADPSLIQMYWVKRLMTVTLIMLLMLQWLLIMAWWFCVLKDKFAQLWMFSHFQLIPTPMESWGKFRSPPNISRASQQNSNGCLSAQRVYWTAACHLHKDYCDWTTLTVSKLFKVFLLAFDALLQLSSGQSATVHISLLHSCGADKPFMVLISVMRVL